MTDTDRLAALLIEVFPAANRNQWPFTAMDVANALIAAGVTLAATPAPLDVLVAAKDVDLSWFVADLGDGTVKMRYASDFPRVLNALREALAANKDATPAPLDVERLARALRRIAPDFEWPVSIGVVSYTDGMRPEPFATLIAREYAQSEETR